MSGICLECGDKFKGRSDKKFCSDQCRNDYNNRINKDANNYVRWVNYILRKNRRILAGINKKTKIKVHKSTLIEKGFNFDFYTNTCPTKNGNTLYFCYDQGYTPLNNNYYVLHKKTSDAKRELH